MGNAKSSCSNPYSNLYEIPVNTYSGDVTTLERYKGKVLIIVNVASKWDLTDQYYSELARIEHDYKLEGVEILAFPCNQFLSQEPGTNDEIFRFVRSKGAFFPVFGKIEVNGDNACDLYKFLRLNSNLKEKELGWNFGKFLISRDGQKIKYFVPKISPLKLRKEIQMLL